MRVLKVLDDLGPSEMSLPEAAHAAGFADSAHFSRTFLRMFGLPAAALELVAPKIQPPPLAGVSGAFRP